jgi:hypothetical protein
VSSTGVSFAAWVDKEGRFVGRWIARKLIEHDQQTLQPEVSYAVRQGICFAGASSGDNEQGISAQHALRAALPKTRPRGYCSFAGRLVTSTRIHLAFEPCRANASK